MKAVPVTPQTSLYWSKLGKWQILTAILTLAIFFITLQLTGDKRRAVHTALAATASASIILALATAFDFAALALVALAATATVVTIASAAPAVLILAGIVIAVIVTKSGIRERVFWLSCAAEFMIILLPMLLA